MNRSRSRSDDPRMHTDCFQHNFECWDGKPWIVTEFIACFKDEDFGGECHNIVELVDMFQLRLKNRGKSSLAVGLRCFIHTWHRQVCFTSWHYYSYRCHVVNVLLQLFRGIHTRYSRSNVPSSESHRISAEMMSDDQFWCTNRTVKAAGS